MKLPRTYAERHGEAIFACEMTAGRLPAHGDDARPRVAKGSHWYPPDNAPHVRQPVPARRERRVGSRSDTDALTSRSPKSKLLAQHPSRRRGARSQGIKVEPHRPQPVAIALSRSTKTPSRTPSDPLAGMLTVAVPMGA